MEQLGPDAQAEERLTMLKRFTIMAAVVFIPLFSLAFVHAQSPDLKPTEVQQLRLEVKQKTALLAQRDVTDAQTRFNQALGDLQDEAAKVEKENKWSDVQFDPQALTFKPMPKAAEKKP